MSLVVNLIFDEGGYYLSHFEDARTGEKIEHVGKWINLEDGLRALQLRVVGLDAKVIDGLDICPSCLREIPPPPPDLTWKRSLP